MSLTREIFLLGARLSLLARRSQLLFCCPNIIQINDRSDLELRSWMHSNTPNNSTRSFAAGLRLFPIDVPGKTVVLKPNLVDYIPGNAINTHPVLVLAAAESFRHMGAKSVVVAEGPGHQRDTQFVFRRVVMSSVFETKRFDS